MRQDMSNDINLPYQRENILDADIQNYSLLLKAWGVSFVEWGHYLQVGETGPGAGWIISVSITENHVLDLLRKIVPVLLGEKVPFRIIRSFETAQAMLVGLLGHTSQGKIVSVLLDSPARAAEIAQSLIKETAAFKGPAIQTDYSLAGIVYAAYGGLSSMMITGSDGVSRLSYIDQAGNLQVDPINIPFILPDGVDWPFASIKGYTPEKGPSRILNGQFAITGLIKMDTKGGVYDAVRIVSFWKREPAIIKEAIEGMASDFVGRDVQDKLDWQHLVITDLKDIVPFPEILAYFTVCNRKYMAMKKLKGRTMGAEIDAWHGGLHWLDMKPAVRERLIGQGISAADFVAKMHGHGYYHRDINSRNFFVTDALFYGLDPELAYNFKKGLPAPPFVLGSPGYISPEQRRVETPTAAQDVYSLGALIMRIFTGLPPRILSADDPATLFHHLKWLTGNREISLLLCRCMDYDPTERPHLSDIRNALVKTSSEIALQALQHPSPEATKDLDLTDVVRGVISKGIAGLASDRLATPEGIWFSRPVVAGNNIANESQELAYLQGLSRGVAGPLLFLAEAAKAKFNIGIASERYRHNWGYLHAQHFDDSNPNFPTGLYFGVAGTCIAFERGAVAGLINPEPLCQLIDERLSRFPEGLNISTGMAGHGLAVQKCREILPTGRAEELLTEIVRRILRRQEKDGSWTIQFTGSDRKQKLTSFSYGTAGIAHFLLSTGDSGAIEAGLRALAFLRKNCFRDKKQAGWLQYPGGNFVDPWLEAGSTGIVIPFLQGYTLTKDPSYKSIVELTLKTHPERIVTPFLSILAGAAGLGMTYLEAHSVFSDTEYRTRARNIVELLLHTYQPTPDDGVCWVADKTTLATADLLAGGTGLLLFLLRWLEQQPKFIHP